MGATSSNGTRGPASQPGSYLVVTNWRRHLHYSDRRAKWIKAYVAGDDDGRRGLDDDVLTGLPVATRLFAELFLKLAARMDNFVPFDARRIAGWVVMRPQDVSRAILELVDEGYLEVVSDVKVAGNGELQLPLTAPPGAGEKPGDRSRPAPNGARPDPVADPDLTSTSPPSRPRPGPIADTVRLSLEAASRGNPASDTLELTRAGARAAEQDRDLETSTSKATVLEDAAPALPFDSVENPLVGRIIALACRGDAKSASIVRREAQGMPEHVLAQALESLIGRRPRPANPGGYIVGAIRHIAHEAGIARPTPATIDREPDLD